MMVSNMSPESIRAALANANIADKKFKPNIKKPGGVAKKAEKLKKIIKGAK